MSELLVFGLMVGIGGLVLGLNIGKSKGHREVASGQVKCELAEGNDKTTYWHCEEIK